MSNMDYCNTSVCLPYFKNNNQCLAFESLTGVSAAHPPVDSNFEEAAPTEPVKYQAKETQNQESHEADLKEEPLGRWSI